MHKALLNCQSNNIKVAWLLWVCRKVHNSCISCIMNIVMLDIISTNHFHWHGQGSFKLCPVYQQPWGWHPDLHTLPPQRWRFPPASLWSSSDSWATATSCPSDTRGTSLRSSAANRLIGEVVRSRRRPLLGPSPGWKRLLALSHLRHY